LLDGLSVPLGVPVTVTVSAPASESATLQAPRPPPTGAPRLSAASAELSGQTPHAAAAPRAPWPRLGPGALLAARRGPLTERPAPLRTGRGVLSHAGAPCAARPLQLDDDPSSHRVLSPSPPSRGHGLPRLDRLQTSTRSQCGPQPRLSRPLAVTVTMCRARTRPRPLTTKVQSLRLRVGPDTVTGKGHGGRWRRGAHLKSLSHKSRHRLQSGRSSLPLAARR
jgi:hypothetical protein